ncbi:MAG: hypothetical protein ABIU85_02230 [Methylotenera sp.]
MCAILLDTEEEETPNLLPITEHEEGYQSSDIYAMVAIAQLQED